MLSERSIKHSINRIGSMLTIFFNQGWISDYASAVRSDTKMYAKFHHAMLEVGIYLTPSQFEACLVLTEHKPQDIERTIRAAQKALSSGMK